MPPPARILSTSSPLISDTYNPARLMLRGQLAPEVLKLIPLRSVSLKMRMSPSPLSRRQTLDPDRTLASGKLSGSRCVLAAFHAHVTLEKSTVRLSGFADFMLLAWAVATPPCACAFVVPIVGVAGEITADGPVGDRAPPSSSSPPHPAVDINSASVIPVVILIVILPFNLMRWPRFRVNAAAGMSSGTSAPSPAGGPRCPCRPPHPVSRQATLTGAARTARASSPLRPPDPAPGAVARAAGGPAPAQARVPAPPRGRTPTARPSRHPRG